MSKIPVGVKVLLVLGLMTGPALAKPMFLVDDDPPPGSVAAKINAVQSAVTASASFLDYDGSTSIDFGDYFAFADKFGLATGDTGFDAAYDADGSGKVEYGDFFIFGDNFGTAAAGAFKYDPPGPGAGPFTNAAATFALSGSSTVEVGAGQTLQVGIDATGLVGAKQFEVVLEVSPASAFNLSSPTFALGGGFTSAIAPGVLSPAAAQVKGGAAFLTGSGVDGASALGTLQSFHKMENLNHEIGGACRWAIMQITGENLPLPEPTRRPQVGWFLESTEKLEHEQYLPAR